MSSSFGSFRSVARFLSGSVLSGGLVVSALRLFVRSGSAASVSLVGGRRVVFQRGVAFRCLVSGGCVFVVVPRSFSFC